MRSILQRLKILRYNKPSISANIFESYDSVGKSKPVLSHQSTLYIEMLSRFVSIVVNDAYDLDHHIFLSSLSEQILFRDSLVYILIAPYFQFSLLTYVKHALEYLKIPVTFV